MKDSINLPIAYTVRFSTRAKRVRLSIYPNMQVVVTMPVGMKLTDAEKFVQAKHVWILKSLAKFQKYQSLHKIQVEPGAYKKYKTQALALARAKVEQWNKFYNFKYTLVSIRNSKTRWGSCSKRGALNFNYKIIYLPEKLQDYLVVHELCHLKELNHSAKFWEEVAKTIPSFKEDRKKLKQIIA